jgi:hypothetical protein
MIPTDAPVVRRGHWLYNGMVPCEVRIVRHNVLYGTGDAEDTPDIAEDRDVECYYLLFHTPVKEPDWVGGGAALTLADAADIAKSLLGSTLTWDDCVMQGTLPARCKS